jgi:Holliday junction resolvase RusA-like endonuclease
MIVFEIPGVPIPLQRHRHAGKKCFDPQKREKRAYQTYIASRLNGVLKTAVAIKLIVEYHMPIPKSYSKTRVLECVLGPHSNKPDLSNLIKFTEDTFNGMLWKDDSLIAEIEARKFYAQVPKTVFKIESIGYKYTPVLT